MVTIANINGSKKFVPGGENRAHRPTHKILSADKIKKRSLLIDTIFLRPYQLSSSLPIRPFLTASSILSMIALE